MWRRKQKHFSRLLFFSSYTLWCSIWCKKKKNLSIEVGLASAYLYEYDTWLKVSLNSIETLYMALEWRSPHSTWAVSSRGSASISTDYSKKGWKYFKGNNKATQWQSALQSVCHWSAVLPHSALCSRLEDCCFLWERHDVGWGWGLLFRGLIEQFQVAKISADNFTPLGMLYLTRALNRFVTTGQLWLIQNKIISNPIRAVLWTM